MGQYPLARYPATAYQDLLSATGSVRWVKKETVRRTGTRVNAQARLTHEPVRPAFGSADVLSG